MENNEERTDDCSDGDGESDKDNNKDTNEEKAKSIDGDDKEYDSEETEEDAESNEEGEESSDVSDEIEVDSNVDEISQTTESDVLTELSEQAMCYASTDRESHNTDVEKTINTYVKKIYRQVKFLSENGKEWREPNFIVHAHEIRSQATEICEYLWKSLGKLKNLNIICILFTSAIIHLQQNKSMFTKGKSPENPTFKQKIMFWKTYQGSVKKEINRLRQVSVSQFRQLFFKGKLNNMIRA